MDKYYSGIGNRTIPAEIDYKMQAYAAKLAEAGFILRSGGAGGSDTAFEQGAGDGPKEIYTHKDATAESKVVAMEHHPAPQACSDFVKKLHGRNAMITLGKDLDTYSEFVCCYAVDENKGGTALGIKIAKAYDIPVFNLYHGVEEFETFLVGLLK